MRRRNPPSGNVTFNNVTMHNLTAGILAGEADDNAEHTLHGATTVSGAADTIVLLVEERAHIQDLLTASRLSVGLTTAADPESDDPHEASPYDDSPYPDTQAGGGATPPELTGFTVDPGGNVRTSGFVVVKNAPDAVVLRAPNGLYYSFTVGSDGQLDTTGRLVSAPP